MPSGIPVSSRRPRSSIGPLELAGLDGTNQPCVDLEFRRKHSRQNKEIIGENVAHKVSIRVLRDEVTALKEELLEVKHANRIMTGRVNALRRERSSEQTTAGLAALDTLLEALPALQQLREQIAPDTKELPPIPYEITRSNLLRNMGMSIATRPAASGSRIGGLGTLSEEDGTEQTIFDIPAIASRKPNNRSPFAKAAPRSPNPPGLRKAPPPPTFIVNSPVSPASPSPRKRIVHSSKQKPKRRRESGLLLPPRNTGGSQSSPTPTPTPSTSSGETEDAEWTDRIDVAEAEGMPGSSSEPGTDIASEISVTPDAVPNRSNTSSASSDGVTPQYNLSDLLSPRSVAAIAEEEGKRGRRARSSVNYKEPSLTKKMRKPDGIASADMLAHRRSLAAQDVATEMALPRPGMRRKSVLPRSQGKLSDPASFDDEDEIEESLLATSREASPLSGPSDNSSELSDPPSTSSRSSHLDTGASTGGSEIERVPTPIPPMEAEPTVDNHTIEAAPPQAAATVPTRTSPRKQTLSSSLKARRPSTLVVRPRPSRVITPSSRAREALASMTEPNQQVKSTRTASQTGAGSAKRL